MARSLGSRPFQRRPTPCKTPRHPASAPCARAPSALRARAPCIRQNVLACTQDGCIARHEATGFFTTFPPHRKILSHFWHMILVSPQTLALGCTLLLCACASSNAPSHDASPSQRTAVPLPKTQATHERTQRWTFPASIRSLNVLDDRSVAFAGSNGFVGMTHNAGMSWDTARWTAPDGRHPSFRASALFPERFFAVSIEDPGHIVEFQEGLAVSTVRHSDARNGVFWDAMAWWNPREGLVFGDPVEAVLLCSSHGTADGPGGKRLVRPCPPPFPAKLPSQPPTETLRWPETRRGCSQAACIQGACAAWTAEARGRLLNCPSCRANP